jgi:hypothetical protein
MSSRHLVHTDPSYTSLTPTYGVPPGFTPLSITPCTPPVDIHSPHAPATNYPIPSYNIKPGVNQPLIVHSEPTAQVQYNSKDPRFTTYIRPDNAITAQLAGSAYIQTTSAIQTHSLNSTATQTTAGNLTSATSTQTSMIAQTDLDAQHTTLQAPTESKLTVDTVQLVNGLVSSFPWDHLVEEVRDKLQSNSEFIQNGSEITQPSFTAAPSVDVQSTGSQTDAGPGSCSVRVQTLPEVVLFSSSGARCFYKGQ